MEQNQYRETLERLFSESRELAERRDALEAELSEVKSQIVHLDAVLDHLRPLAGLAIDEDISGLGITEAIRAVLRNSKARMSATEVRLALKAKGFDLSSYSAPMSSIYKILGRLAEDANTPVIRHKDESGGGVFYEWQDPDDYAQQAEISDDDIPF
jgi:hypothetical protein